MNKRLLFVLLLIVTATANAQTILKGDMNNDNSVTIADVTSLVNVILGKAPQEKISVGGSPYKVDNTSVVGTWYAPDGTSFTLNDDGTTDYGTGFTYKFRPYQGTLMMFNSSGAPVKTFVLNEVETAYLLAIDYATGVYTYYTNSGSLATGINISPSTLEMNSGTTAQLMATLSPEGAFGSVTWTSSDENVATVDANGVVTGVAGGTCTITATTSSSLKKDICAVTVKQSVTSIILSQTIVILELDAFVRLSTTILPDNAANKNLIWSSNNENVATVRNGRIDAYGYGTAEITCEAADGSGAKATCVVYIIDPETYVDLDLPSHTLWATCNVGANKPEEFGDYFAWGETDKSGKSQWDWTSYKWCEGTYNSQIKYCTDSYFGYEGFVDGKTELETEDDAAFVNWGPAWRMPSIIQLEELINSNYTTTEWTTQNGVSGYRITSNSNGNFIFLPAAGMYEKWSWGRPGFGYYWSRTLHVNSEGGALSVNFGSGQIISSSGNRYYGWSIRPVRSLQ